MIYCCMNCTKRYPGCHSKCKEYMEQKRKHDECREKLKKENDIIHMISESNFHRMITRDRKKHN